jgi:hypothetical protein
MHFVENLPAGMGFSALCGSSLHRVENRLADLEFSTICMWLERFNGGRGTLAAGQDPTRARPAHRS